AHARYTDERRVLPHLGEVDAVAPLERPMPRAGHREHQFVGYRPIYDLQLTALDRCLHTVGAADGEVNVLYLHLCRVAVRVHKPGREQPAVADVYHWHLYSPRDRRARMRGRSVH